MLLTNVEEASVNTVLGPVKLMVIVGNTPDEHEAIV